MAEYRWSSHDQKDGVINNITGRPCLVGSLEWDKYIEYVDAGGTTDPWGSPSEMEHFDLERKFLEIENETALDSNTPFEYNGNNYYPDMNSIIAVVLMAVIDPNMSIDWKTADKPDGLNNVYVTLNSQQIIEMGRALFSRNKSIWARGDSKKKDLKKTKDEKTKS